MEEGGSAFHAVNRVVFAAARLELLDRVRDGVDGLPPFGRLTPNITNTKAEVDDAVYSELFWLLDS